MTEAEITEACRRIERRMAERINARDRYEAETPLPSCACGGYARRGETSCRTCQAFAKGAGNE